MTRGYARINLLSNRLDEDQRSGAIETYLYWFELQNATDIFNGNCNARQADTLGKR
jgi:hypothetical protein